MFIPDRNTLALLAQIDADEARKDVAEKIVLAVFAIAAVVAVIAYVV